MLPGEKYNESMLRLKGYQLFDLSLLGCNGEWQSA